MYTVIRVLEQVHNIRNMSNDKAGEAQHGTTETYILPKYSEDQYKNHMTSDLRPFVVSSGALQHCKLVARGSSVALFCCFYRGSGTTARDHPYGPRSSFHFAWPDVFQLWEDCCAVLMKNWSAFPFENNLYV
jgi:hypothetical protein